jgi:2-haloacid dehalogenase
MNKPTIIFDFGNVLVPWDLFAIYDRFFPDRAAMDAFLAEVSFLQWNSRMDSGEPFAECVADISAQYPQYAQLFRLYDERWVDTLRGSIPENILLVDRLKRAGYELCLLSNISAEKFPLALDIHPFLDHFDTRVLSGEVKMIKPERGIFVHTLKQLGRSPDACIFIDDNLANIETARSLGIPSIHFQSPQQLESELQHFHIVFP